VLDTITETGIIDNDSSEREHIILSGEVNESITRYRSSKLCKNKYQLILKNLKIMQK